MRRWITKSSIDLPGTKCDTINGACSAAIASGLAPTGLQNHCGSGLARDEAGIANINGA